MNYAKPLFVSCLFWCCVAGAQTLGGRTAFNFLRLSPSAMLSAAGGVAPSYQSGVGNTAYNPALLKPAHHTAVATSFQALPGAITAVALTGALYSDKKAMAFGGHIFYVDYGRLPQTDAAGNVSGEFAPREFVVQASAAKAYLTKWMGGLTVKLIHSSLGQYSSSALAADVGLLYTDSAAGFSASLLIKNMGAQLSRYAGETEELPFDVQVGFTKKLAKAPFAFSVSAQQIHRYNIRYATAANASALPASGSFADNIFSHFVLASHIYLSTAVVATMGYNQLRKGDLQIGEGGNGLNGFSYGLQASFPRFEVSFSRQQYQRAVATNQLALSTQLNKLFGLGR